MPIASGMRTEKLLIKPRVSVLRALKIKPKIISFRRPNLSVSAPADHLTKKTSNGKEPKHNTGFGHPHVEFLGDIEGKEWEEHRSADMVNERHAHHHPESAREFLRDFLNIHIQQSNRLINLNERK